VETCPHYLCFAAEDLPDGDPRCKCAPPIRSARHREALWSALGDGIIDLIASDHSPAPPERKTGSLMSAWGGIASLQVSLAAIWTEARRRGFGLDEVAHWMSTAPAARLGLEGKGRIATGRDADLVVFDPEATWTVRGTELEHRHPETLYEGCRLDGTVLRVLVGGRDRHPFG
ncbi:MAG: amidohydrolase family protein, partial [Acidobacteriota bacterium]